MTTLEHVILEGLKAIEGQDEEIKELRNRIPEPSRVKNLEWIVMIPRRDFFTAPIPESCTTEFTPVQTITFVKRLIHCKGLKVWVWVCTKDGKFYL